MKYGMIKTSGAIFSVANKVACSTVELSLRKQPISNDKIKWLLTEGGTLRELHHKGSLHKRGPNTFRGQPLYF